MKDFDYAKFNSVNPLYIIIDEANGYIEEKNGNKYLIFASTNSTDKNKKVLARYKKLWDKIKYQVKTINGGETGENEKDFMNIKFNSSGNLPLNKTLKLHMETVIVRSVFQEGNKYYVQVFLDEYLCEL